jgi:hypothetical protein
MALYLGREHPLEPRITSEVLYQLSYVGGTVASYRRSGR